MEHQRTKTLKDDTQEAYQEKKKQNTKVQISSKDTWGAAVSLTLGLIMCSVA